MPLCIGSMEPQPLDHQGSPWTNVLTIKIRKTGQIIKKGQQCFSIGKYGESADLASLLKGEFSGRSQPLPHLLFFFFKSFLQPKMIAARKLKDACSLEGKL